MNKDYTYCVGFSQVAPHGLCKNCRWYIPKGQEPNEAIWWTSAQYDPNTDKCPLYESKTESNECCCIDVNSKLFKIIQDETRINTTRSKEDLLPKTE